MSSDYATRSRLLARSVMQLRPDEPWLPNYQPDGIDEGEITEQLEDTLAEADGFSEMIEAVHGAKADRRGANPLSTPADVAGGLGQRVMDASINPDTIKGHESWLKVFDIEEAKRAPADRVDAMVPSLKLVEHMIAFIAFRCCPKSEGGQGQAYSTAQAIRAAFTYRFRQLDPQNPDRVFEWDPANPASPGKGNPSRAVMMGTFMLSLSKMKARNGEVPQSVRAMREEELLLLFEDMIIKKSSPHSVQAYTIFLTAFLCCMRMDEPLSLSARDIEFPSNGHSIRDDYLVLHLRLRKTHQAGGVHPYYLHRNDLQPALCPYRAILRWWAVTHQSGSPNPYPQPDSPLFFDTAKNGNLVPGRRLTTPTINGWLRTALKRLGVRDWHLYGSHSFRRGGTQYWCERWQWTLPMLLAWGGWTNTETGTILKYLYSPNDVPKDISDYTNPFRNLFQVDAHARRLRNLAEGDLESITSKLLRHHETPPCS